MEIKKVVVIGSGTMGSGIAAHLCNANIPETLLDLKTEISEQARDKILSEDDLFKLELGAFMRLIETKETQDRIKHTLATGKPLIN